MEQEKEGDNHNLSQEVVPERNAAAREQTNERTNAMALEEM